MIVVHPPPTHRIQAFGILHEVCHCCEVGLDLFLPSAQLSWLLFIAGLGEFLGNIVLVLP